MTSECTGGLAEGLRARKQRETRQRIAEAGFNLFLANGFEATTLDAVAAAAGISRRTFFHYFDSKEALLFAWEREIEDGMRAAVAARPEDEAALDAVPAVITTLIDCFETDRAVAIDRLMRSTAALRTRKQANYERHERDLFAALATRWPKPERQTSLRLAAMVGIGALRIAADAWSHESGARPLGTYFADAFGRLRDEFAREAPTA